MPGLLRHPHKIQSSRVESGLLGDQLMSSIPEISVAGNVVSNPLTVQLMAPSGVNHVHITVGLALSPDLLQFGLIPSAKLYRFASFGNQGWELKI